MRKILSFLIIAIAFCLPCFTQAASPLRVEINKIGVAPEYTVGETIEAEYSFVNGKSQPGLFRIICSFELSVGEFPPMPDMKEVQLMPSQSSDKLTCSMKVGETTPAGPYVLNIKVLDEENNSLAAIERKFVIKGTKKIISAELKTCLDLKCDNQITVFTLDQDVFVRFEGEEMLNISGLVREEKGEERVLSGDILVENDTYMFSNLPVGNYEISLNAQAKGYETANFKNNFVVIATPAKIRTITICNLDGECKGEETEQNCPLDCKISKNKIILPEEADKKVIGGEEESNLIKRILLGGIVLLIIVFSSLGYYFQVVKKKDENLGNKIK